MRAFRLFTFSLYAAAALVAVATSLTAAADVVTDWNVAMTHYGETLPPPGLQPPLESRLFAMVHVAMFNAIDRATNPKATKSTTEQSKAEAAGAQAAHDVLIHELADGAATFDRLLAQHIAAISNDQKKTQGLRIGSEAAAELLASRANDGAASSEAAFTPGSQPGDYQFTPPFDSPPFNGYAANPTWGKVVPFVLTRGDQFRLPAPYTVQDPAYVADFKEVKTLGSRENSTRTSDESEAAQFWYEYSELGWNRIARILAAQQSNSLLEHARLFAALNAAMADALIAGCDSKYTYRFWRPITAIRKAETDHNDLTEADPAWEPLMLTPPMPDYPSTHSSMGSAASVVLIWFFHGDEHPFTFASTMVAAFPQLKPRTFRRISDAAIENARSRVLAGIHFRRACDTGLEQGRKVGNWVVDRAPFCAVAVK